MPFSRAGPAYDPAVLSMLQQAYDDACREIGVDPHPSDQARDKETREALATAIMDLAATGCVIRMLRERALQLTKPTRPQAGRHAVKRLLSGRCRRSRTEAPAAGRRLRLRSKCEGSPRNAGLLEGAHGRDDKRSQAHSRASRTRDCYAPQLPGARPYTLRDPPGEPRRTVMKVWNKPQVHEQEVGLEVTSYLPAEIDII